jgi:hypothetical protein
MYKYHVSHVGVGSNKRVAQLAGDAVENGMHLFVILIFSLCLGQGCWKVSRVAGMVVIWEDMLTLFGL